MDKYSIDWQGNCILATIIFSIKLPSIRKIAKKFSSDYI